MQTGRTTLGLAFDFYCAEVDDHLERIFAIGEDERAEHAPTPLAVEHRLLIHWGERGAFEGIEARDLGVVNEDFAFRKADAMVREREASNVVVEAREVLRGRWHQVERP